LLAPAVLLADAPKEPLHGFYSFDRQSPSVQSGLVAPDAVLDYSTGSIVVVTTGADVGAGVPGDEIDAMSSLIPPVPIGQTFSILFSVDRATVGVKDPDPFLVQQGRPYNVKHQAFHGHAAGDQFISLDIFLISGGVAGVQVLGSGSNNSQVRNNFDEGGTSFGGDPKTGSSGTSTGSQDGVDGTAGTTAVFAVAGVPAEGFFFSVTPDSPSLSTLSGSDPPSGASIFLNTAPGDPTQTRLFLSYVDLGLEQADDISGMVVFDWNLNTVFDASDAVLFTLAPGSPSLDPADPTPILGLSQIAPSADVILVTAPGGNPRVLVPAVMLGLGYPDDSIDALDALQCTDGLACALAHAIMRDTVPAVSEWGLVAFAIVLLTAGTILMRRTRQRTALIG